MNQLFLLSLLSKSLKTGFSSVYTKWNQDLNPGNLASEPEFLTTKFLTSLRYVHISFPTADLHFQNPFQRWYIGKGALFEKSLSRIKSSLGDQVVWGLTNWVWAGGGIRFAGFTGLYSLTYAVSLSCLGSSVSTHLGCRGIFLRICVESPGALPSHTHPDCSYLRDSCSQDWDLEMQCHLTKHWLDAVHLRHCPTEPEQTGSLHKGHQQAYPQAGHSANMWVTRLAHLVLSLETLGQMLTWGSRDSGLQGPVPHSQHTFIHLS